MQIRRYEDSDRHSMIELLRLNTPQYFSANEEQDLIYYLENHAANHYLICMNDKVLGCGGFNLTEDGETAKISWDIIHPDYHGRGVGSELTRFRIRKIKEIPGVKIISVRTSQLVYKFYEKFGLELREIVKDYWDVGFDMYRLDCEIGVVRILNAGSQQFP